MMWQSYHLYRPRPHDRFLVDEVKPFVESLQPDSFFFIRYADPADHVRLRLKSEESLDERVLRIFPDAQIVAYVPEVERYVDMAVAERQFELSSRAVLDALSRADWSYDLALQIAMRMHLDLAEAFALDRQEFFASTVKRFIRRPDQPRDGEAEARRLAEFDRRELGPASSDPRWLDGMREIAARFGNGGRNALQGFVHMTNNRLGIVNRDEAWLAFLLSRSLR